MARTFSGFQDEQLATAPALTVRLSLPMVCESSPLSVFDNNKED